MTPAFTTFAFDFVQNKRNKWSSVRQYRSSFFVTDAVLDRFVNFAKSEYGIQVRNDEIQHSKSRIKRILKGEIARQIWVEQGYYQVVNPEDNEVQKAVQLVSKP
jgi:hypothetical protein